MYNAPSVSYPVERSRMARALFISIWILGAAGVTGWWFQAAAGAFTRALALSLLAAAGLAVWRGIAADQGTREITWDGQGWTVTGESPATQWRGALADVRLDFQGLILARFVAPGKPALWLWLARETMPARWLALRRALYAPVRDTEATNPPPETGTAP